MKTSSYQKLLTPKAGGAWTVLNSGLGITKIIDLTISYDKGARPFYYFFTGRLKIRCYVRVKDVPDLNQYSDFKLWMQELWGQKDQLLLKDEFNC